jgi:hypothetical protein
VTVTLTSPVLGKDVGDDYTGTLEDWLLAEGYAKRAGYTGPGVSNTGVTDIVPAKDPTLPANRGDKPWFPAQDVESNVANDTANLTKTHTKKPFDFDQGGVDEDTATPAADGDTNNDGVADAQPGDGGADAGAGQPA